MSASKFLTEKVPHPGETLLELILSEQMQSCDCIEHEEIVKELCHLRIDIDEEIAFMLQKYSDIKADFWLSRQFHYNAWIKERAECQKS